MSKHGDEYKWVSSELANTYRIAYMTGNGLLQVKEVYLTPASGVITTILEPNDMVKETLFPTVEDWLESLPHEGAVYVTPFEQQLPSDEDLTAIKDLINKMPAGLIKTQFQQGLNEVNKTLHLRLDTSWRPQQLKMLWIPQD